MASTNYKSKATKDQLIPVPIKEEDSQENSEDDLYCNIHPKRRLQYLNYSLDLASVFVCKRCVQDKNLKEAFDMHKLDDNDENSFLDIQKDNYQKVRATFKSIENDLEIATEQLCDFVISAKNNITRIVKQEYLKQLGVNQSNITYDLKALVESYQEGRLPKSEFESEIGKQFKKERSISNPKDQRYNKVNMLYKKLTTQFIKFEKEIEYLVNDLEEKQVVEEKIFLPGLKGFQVEKNLSLFKKCSFVTPQLENRNANFLPRKACENSKLRSYLKKPAQPIHFSEINSKNDLRMIATKNKYGDLKDITSVLPNFINYSNKLKVLSFQNVNKIKEKDLNEFSEILSNSHIISLNYIDLNFKRSFLNPKLCAYISSFSVLYPNLQHFKLSVKSHNIVESMKSLSEGLENIRENLITFELKLNEMDTENLDSLEMLFSRVLKHAKNLKVLRLKFKSFSIAKKECYRFLFYYVVQNLKELTSLQVFDLSIPNMKDVFDQELTDFSKLIKQQKQLTYFRIRLGDFPSTKTLMASNQIMKSLQAASKLKCFEFTLPRASNLDISVFQNLNLVIKNNQQLQELKIDCFLAKQIEEEGIMKLFDSFQFLKNLTKLRVNLSQGENISDFSLNYLFESLDKIYNSSQQQLHLESFEIYLRNNTQITDTPILNLISILSTSENLKKLKLCFLKNKNSITPKPLELLTQLLSENAFQNLRNLTLEFGNERFNNSILNKFLTQLKKIDQLTSVRLYFGKSLFNDDLIKDLVKLVETCKFLKCVDLNFFKSNAFTQSKLKILISVIAGLDYLSEFKLDVYYSKIQIDLIIYQKLKQIEAKCDHGFFQINIEERMFNSTQHICQQYRKSFKNTTCHSQDSEDIQVYLLKEEQQKSCQKQQLTQLTDKKTEKKKIKK